MSIVAIHSGWRRDFYSRPDCTEHEAIFREIVSTDHLRPQVFLAAEGWIEAILHRSMTFQESDGWIDGLLLRKQWGRARRKRKRIFSLHYYQIVGWILAWFGIHPTTGFVIKDWGWRRGELIRNQQRIIGLERGIE